ncbi:unnamed protein product [Rotaria sp. Silwood2]|nr:unnamed protein product [Rotaria sp. Silwood2]
MHHLKVLSTKYKAELGIKSTTLIANILQGDITDLQLVQLALETLTNIMTYDVDSDEVLLQHLIGSNPDVQVLIVIKYGFQYILDIIVSKQSVDEDLTVEDCLSLLLTLFQNNSKNQLYFCQSFCVRYLFDAFELSLTRETRWSTQKVTNVHLLLQIIRTVVSPKNSIKNIRTCQHLLKQYGKDRKTITRGNI